MKNIEKFLQKINNPFASRFFLLTKLPSAYLCGVRVLLADEKKCVVTVPYTWFSKNPFKSIYFACLGMAAEMSTGVLAMAHIYKNNPPVSMLVTRLEGEYYKKALGLTTFTCEDGLLIKQTIEDAIASGQAKIITAKTFGRNKAGEIVANFDITWSFKVKRTAS